MEQKYIDLKEHEDEALNKGKAAQWAGEIHERLVGKAEESFRASLSAFVTPY